MPLTTLHLLTLTPSTSLSHYLSLLSTALPAEKKPLTISRPVRWIIRPSRISVPALLDHPWDILIILPSAEGLPAELLKPELVAQTYTLRAGVPSSITKGWEAKNAALLHPEASAVPKLTGAWEDPRIAASAQKLELSPDLRAWIPRYYNSNGEAGKGAVSMLNLLAFGAGMQQEYLKYGKAFAESIGKKRGGAAKIVGKVIPADPKAATPSEKEGSHDWEEIALAHYPSILHFGDMIGSEDYQEVNHRHRVPALRDTCILMTCELGLPGSEEEGGKAKL